MSLLHINVNDDIDDKYLGAIPVVKNDSDESPPIVEPAVVE